MIAGN